MSVNGLQCVDSNKAKIKAILSTNESDTIILCKLVEAGSVLGQSNGDESIEQASEALEMCDATEDVHLVVSRPHVGVSYGIGLGTTGVYTSLCIDLMVLWDSSLMRCVLCLFLCCTICISSPFSLQLGEHIT